MRCVRNHFYDILIICAGTAALVGLIETIWYGTILNGDKGYAGNLFEFFMYSYGLFLEFVYAIILKKNQLKKTEL